jgi:hypothetical protein
MSPGELAARAIASSSWTAGASRQRLAVFAALWAAAILFDLASNRAWSGNALLAALAAWTLLQPTSVIPLAALAAGHILTFVRASPFVSNHTLFAVMVDAALLAAIAIVMMRHGRLRADAGEIFDVWAPAVRAAVVVLYVFVVFHKLNADFFNPVVSCGTIFYAEQIKRFAFLPHARWAGILSLYAVIVTEAAIPVLLSVRRTRNAGVLVGAGFHWMLAVNPRDAFYNFSSMLFAVFFVFAAAGPMCEWLARVDPRRVTRASRAFLLVALGCAIVQVWMRRTSGSADQFLLLWTVYGLGLMVSFAWVVRGRWKESAPAGATFMRPAPALIVLPIVVALNGISPYVGFKTELSWAMFSNLRTDSARSNHFIVPAAWRISSDGDDLVSVVASSDRGLAQVGQSGDLIPYFELRRHPDASITYVRSGLTRVFAHVRDDPRYTPLSWIARKTRAFRPVSAAGPETCHH